MPLPVVGVCSGSTVVQISIAYEQRVWNRHPEGGLIGLGTSPSSTMRVRVRSTGGFGTGIAESRASE